MILRKNLNKAVRLSGKEILRQLSKTTTNSDSVALCLNKFNFNAVREEKRVVKMLHLQKSNRYLSTLNSNQMPLAAMETAASKDERRDLMAIFPDLVRDVTDTGKHLDVPEALIWIAKVLQYNVPGGKMFRGLSTALAYKILENPENLTPENLRLAKVLGWCVEMFQSVFLIQDDIMDGSTMRRRVPCWHRQPGVGLMALNDSLLLQASMFTLLKKYLHDKPYYKNVLEMFNKMSLKTSIGQFLDMASAKGDNSDLSKFTMDRYKTIVEYKTAYYSLLMPVGLAMLMCGIDDRETHRQAKTILLQMGQYFQIQNDFLDCFGNPAVTGKPGTDIQEGKCTWLSVVALQRANPAQKLVMEEYYGSQEPEHVAKVKALYEELAIPHAYEISEETSYNIISTQIQQITTGLPHELFFKILGGKGIYRRGA